ncbi:hypothetical protein AN958_00713 [Leucoagaricus sp. SymC.cos]|nr:hypothetical protein AN958_00713 [Leucoagaricus sp. SymC.cos]
MVMYFAPSKEDDSVSGNSRSLSAMVRDSTQVFHFIQLERSLGKFSGLVSVEH